MTATAAAIHSTMYSQLPKASPACAAGTTPSISISTMQLAWAGKPAASERSIYWLPCKCTCNAIHYTISNPEQQQQTDTDRSSIHPAAAAGGPAAPCMGTQNTNSNMHLHCCCCPRWQPQCCLSTRDALHTAAHAAQHSAGGTSLSHRHDCLPAAATLIQAILAGHLQSYNTYAAHLSSNATAACCCVSRACTVEQAAQQRSGHPSYMAIWLRAALLGTVGCSSLTSPWLPAALI